MRFIICMTIWAHQSSQILNNPFGFTGYQMDDVSGMYYAQAREYSPTIGRFVSQDTHWNVNNMQSNNAAMLQSGNLYAYTMNNPMVWTDPSGLIVSALLGLAAAAVTTVVVVATVASNSSSCCCSSSSGSGSGSGSSGSGGGNLSNNGMWNAAKPGSSASFSNTLGMIVIPVPGGNSGANSGTTSTPWWIPWSNNNLIPTPAHQWPSQTTTGFPTFQQVLNDMRTTVVNSPFGDWVRDILAFPDDVRTVVGGIGDLITMASDGTPRNNQVQNKQVNEAVRRNNLSPEGRERLHRDISGQNYTPREIMEAAADIARLGGKYVR